MAEIHPVLEEVLLNLLYSSVVEFILLLARLKHFLYLR